MPTKDRSSKAKVEDNLTNKNLLRSLVDTRTGEKSVSVTQTFATVRPSCYSHLRGSYYTWSSPTRSEEVISLETNLDTIFLFPVETVVPTPQYSIFSGE